MRKLNKDTIMGLTPPFQDGNGKKIKKMLFLLYKMGKGITKNIPAICDGNGKPKKIQPLFGNKISRLSNWEIYGNGNSRSCLCFPV